MTGMAVCSLELQITMHVQSKPTLINLLILCYAVIVGSDFYIQACFLGFLSAILLKMGQISATPTMKILVLQFLTVSVSHDFYCFLQIW